ncbi:hypothetical protein ACFOLC_11635 [Lysobacter cavernae]|uniref:Uncharacterized protein n=1 Tax=Lysobacter cavernae TaxID=1685901 RepID=A0ABV7RPT9_9GAMM
MRFELSNTHAYPGCKVRVPQAPEGTDDSDCAVEFSDGIVVPGHYAFRAGTITLRVASYETARVTRIDRKSWLLQPDDAEGRWRIRKRIPHTPTGQATLQQPSR